MRRQTFGTLGIIVAIAALVSAAEAQVFIGGGRGIVVDAPGAFVRVAPLRGGITVLPRYPRPVYVAPAPPPLPSADQIARLSDTELLNVTVMLAGRLDADLGRFTSAASWRKHLRLPDDALPLARDGQVEIGLASIIETLRRFDSAAANPGYHQITGLPSFVAMQAALAEVVRRFEGDAPRAGGGDAPARGEELPVPPPSVITPPQNGVRGEQSIISQ